MDNELNPDLYLYYSNVNGTIISVSTAIDHDLSDCPFMRISYSSGKKFLEDINEIKSWKVDIQSDSRDIVEIDKIAEKQVNYIDSSLSRIREKDIRENDTIYITNKNDPTILTDSFVVYRQNIHKIRDKNDYNIYIKTSNLATVDNDSSYVYYSNIDGSIISVESKRIYLYDRLYPFLKVHKHIVNDLVDHSMWKVDIQRDSRDIVEIDSDYVEEINYIDSLFLSFNEREICENDIAYITNKNDPTILNDSLVINRENIHKIEGVNDLSIYYVKHSDSNNTIDDNSSYIYYSNTDGSIVSIEDKKTYYYYGCLYPFLKVHKHIVNDLVDHSMWKVGIHEDLKEVIKRYSIEESSLNYIESNIFLLDKERHRNMVAMFDNENQYNKSKSNRRQYIIIYHREK